MLAETWNVDVLNLLSDNVATVNQLDEPLDGKLLSVCGLCKLTLTQMAVHVT